MDIKNRSVLVLGGGGLVGAAVCRKLMEERPKRIIVTSILRKEADDAVAMLRAEYPGMAKGFFTAWGGNIFVRHTLKDTRRDQIVENPATRRMFIDDTLGELNEEAIKRSAIYRLLHAHKPDIIIDCINSATAIAYQDIFSKARTVLRGIRRGRKTDPRVLREETEKLLCTLYTPQLIRHVQLLYRAMHACGTKIYVKIGTSGTGGMGLNIPYTHSEERPSSVLLGKSAVAGAHTMLLFLMGRTPDAPITKEVKPTAAIAWKRVAFGEIRKRGQPIALVDCPPSRAVKLSGTLRSRLDRPAKQLNQNLRSVFIDTGENGLFSRGEFEAIAAPGQMEFVTPEEIAEAVVYEIKGGNTGHDIINALDNATLSPTYRAGYLFQSALKQIDALEKIHDVDSVAFEMLGPPRLSKLLYEAYLLKLCFKDMLKVMRTDAGAMSKAVAERVRTDTAVRSHIVSIGIPILLPDGKHLLRGPVVKIPPFHGDSQVKIVPGKVNLWAHDGWVDLRKSNMQRWKARFAGIHTMAADIPAGETSSRHMYNAAYWNHFLDIEPGKVAGWIFSYEEKGMRKKA
jgi:hypothetical protein